MQSAITLRRKRRPRAPRERGAGNVAARTRHTSSRPCCHPAAPAEAGRPGAPPFATTLHFLGLFTTTLRPQSPRSVGAPGRTTPLGGPAAVTCRRAPSPQAPPREVGAPLTPQAGPSLVAALPCRARFALPASGPHAPPGTHGHSLETSAWPRSHVAAPPAPEGSVVLKPHPLVETGPLPFPWLLVGAVPPVPGAPGPALLTSVPCGSSTFSVPQCQELSDSSKTCPLPAGGSRGAEQSGWGAGEVVAAGWGVRS